MARTRSDWMCSEQIASPVEFFPRDGLDFLANPETFQFGDNAEGKSVDISRSIVEEVRLEEAKIDSSGRRATRRLSRLAIVCDTPEEYFDIVPGPRSPELVPRSIKLFQDVPQDARAVYTEERMLYYLPKSFKARGASSVRNNKKALLVNPA